MKLEIYQVDAFASQPLRGNPAAVIPLGSWLADEMLQAIANENNLSETVYFIPNGQRYHIRWFTPLHEVKLCGHATMAAAYVLFNELAVDLPEICFDSLSGELTAKRLQDGWLELDFPAQPPVPCEPPSALLRAFSHQPIACLRAEDYVVVFEDEQQVLNAKPIYSQLEDLNLRGVVITAKSERYDFITRFFAPKYGVNEDPVTGSAFTQLIPYWKQVLNKSSFHAKQASPRGGEVKCSVQGDRVKISGQANKSNT